MKILMLALLISLPAVGQQVIPAAKNDTAPQKAEKATGGVVLSEDKKPPYDHTTTADGKKPAAVKPPVPQQNCPERFWIWLKSLNNSDWLLVVTTLYLFATVKIWRAMVKSNEHAEKTYGESKKSADADRELTRRQLEAYERPWVTASFEACGFLQVGMTGNLGVLFRVWLENIGHSIATHISFEVEIVPVEPTDYRHVVATQDRIAQRLKPLTSGPVLFAGEKVANFVRLNLVEVEKYAVNFEGEGRYLFLCLAVVIKYCYPTSDREHTTRVGFTFGNEREFMGGWLLVKLGEELPPEKITILTLPSGGGAD